MASGPGAPSAGRSAQRVDVALSARSNELFAAEPMADPDANSTHTAAGSAVPAAITPGSHSSVIPVWAASPIVTATTAPRTREIVEVAIAAATNSIGIATAPTQGGPVSETLSSSLTAEGICVVASETIHPANQAGLAASGIKAKGRDISTTSPASTKAADAPNWTAIANRTTAPTMPTALAKFGLCSSVALAAQAIRASPAAPVQSG
jgi:hypothetical protein